MHSAVFKPVLVGWDDTKAISMELANDGDSNLITMHCFFDHQLLAGNIYYDVDTSSYVDYFQPLKYTDDDGTLEDFEIYFVPDINFEDGGEYPLILDETEYLAEAHTATGVSEPIDLDINAAFAFTYNINFVADKDIFVGEFLARNNYLIADQQDTHTMEIYKSSKPYTLSDLTNRTGDTVASMTYSYDFANRKITFNALETISHFALTKNGNILLAINRDMVNGESLVVYINIVKNLSDVFFNLEANATGLASLSGSALLAYFYLFANATDLATISGTGVLAYTSRIYPLNATATNLNTINGTGVLVYTSFDYVLQADATGLSTISGSGILSFEATTFVLQANTTNISIINGTAELNYTLQNHLLTADGSVSNISGTADLNYTNQEYVIEATASDISNVGGNIDMTLTYQVWDYIGTSAPPQDDTIDLGTSGTASCRTSTEAKDDLEQTFPASGYAVSFIMRVDHSYEDPVFGTSPCTPFYYRNIEVTV